MKRTSIWLALAVLIATTPAAARELTVGMQASEWSFPDADGELFSMASWEGKVLSVCYVDPDESDLNEHYTEALKKAKNESRLSDEHYKGFGIADCAATWKPNFAIRAIAGRKAEKYKTTILFDTDAVLREAWGLTKNTSNIVILDKNRVCRAIVRGRVPDDQVASLVRLVADLQNE